MRHRRAGGGAAGAVEHDPQRLAARVGADGERGSSASTVPTPTSTASHSARRRWTSARAGSPVIQRLVPSAAAERPSSVAAYFQVTCGRPVRWEVSQASSGPAATSSASRPVTTSTPAARRPSAPRRRARTGRRRRRRPARRRRRAGPACRAGAAGVAAGLQRDDGGAAAGPLAGLRERADLRVRAARGQPWRRCRRALRRRRGRPPRPAGWGWSCPARHGWRPGPRASP